MSCVFCDVIAGEVAAEVVLEDDDFLAFLDHRPVQKGHILMVPRRHLDTLLDLPPELHTVSRRVLSPLESLERDAIVRCLNATGGNKAEAARALGMSRATIYRKIHDYGIGPWEIYEFNPGNVANMREDGQSVERSWRLAISLVGQVQWELIEPLDDGSIYARFLAEKGEGVHHVGLAVANFDETVAAQAERGNGVLLGGEYKGVRAYARTKRMQVVLAEQLAADLDRPGDAVVHSMHPGWAATPGVTDSLPGFDKVAGPILRSPEQGADTIVWLAAAAEPGRSTGKFWHDRRVRRTHYLPWQHDDPEIRHRLWRECVRRTGTQP